MSAAAAAAGRADRPRAAADVHIRRQAGGGARGRHDRLGAVRRRAADLLAQLQVPPARAACCAAAGTARTAWSPSTARRASAHAPSRCARGARRAPERQPSASSSTRWRATDKLGGPFTPPGFYYKTFIRPRRLWPLYEWVLRHAAGLGRLPQRQAERSWRTEYRRRHADLLVVGGGAAGLSAAIAAARARRRRGARRRGPGAGRAPAVGGRRTSTRGQLAGGRATAGVEMLTRGAGARPLRRARARLAGRHAAPGARAPARVRDRRDRAAARVRRQRPARRDALERRAAARARCTRVAPGTRAVVVTLGDRGLLTRRSALLGRRRSLAAVADLRRDARAREPRRAARRRRRGAARLDGGRRARAGAASSASRSRRSTRRAARTPPPRRELACDLLVVSAARRPPRRLIAQAGGTRRLRPRARLLRLAELPPAIWAAGSCWRGRSSRCRSRASARRCGRARGDGASARAARLEQRGCWSSGAARADAVPRARRRLAHATPRGGPRVRVLVRGRHRQGHPSRRRRRATTRSSCASASRR